MSTTIISSMKRIEVFGPNKSKVILNKDEKIQSVKQDWNKKKNRIQIVVGQQSIPSECLEWAMIKAMVEAKIITVGVATVTAEEKAEAKKVKAAVVKETKAAAKLAKESDAGAGEKLPKTKPAK